MLSRRMSCGHMATAGMEIMHAGGGVFLCAACSEQSAKALKGLRHG